METIKAVCKINALGRAEVAYANSDGSRYPLTFYTFQEQHSDGSRDYFRTLRPARTDAERELCERLRKHYEQLGQDDVAIRWCTRLSNN